MQKPVDKLFRNDTFFDQMTAAAENTVVVF